MDAMVRVVFPDVELSVPPVAVLQLSCNPLSSSYPAFFMLNSVVSVVPCLGRKPQLQQSTQQSRGTAAEIHGRRTKSKSNWIQCSWIDRLTVKTKGTGIARFHGHKKEHQYYYQFIMSTTVLHRVLQAHSNYFLNFGFQPLVQAVAETSRKKTAESQPRLKVACRTFFSHFHGNSDVNKRFFRLNGWIELGVTAALVRVLFEILVFPSDDSALPLLPNPHIQGNCSLINTLPLYIDFLLVCGMTFSTVCLLLYDQLTLLIFCDGSVRFLSSIWMFLTETAESKFIIIKRS